MLEAEKLSIIRVGWLTKTFVAGDVLSFLMQASGMSFYCSNQMYLRKHPN
jgi:hypothetical protein